MLLNFRASHLHVGFEHLPVRPFMPCLRRCIHCQAFGHPRKNCRRPLACVRCGGIHHPDACTAPSWCVNCKGPIVPRRLIEERALYLQTRDKITISATHRQARSLTLRDGRIFANFLRSESGPAHWGAVPVQPPSSPPAPSYSLPSPLSCVLSTHFSTLDIEFPPSLSPVSPSTASPSVVPSVDLLPPQALNFTQVRPLRWCSLVPSLSPSPHPILSPLYSPVSLHPRCFLLPLSP